ncbi:MAG: cell surface protein SprA [Candidatus Cloacimonetes bacterium]|nr:cell surface protein SprA [Candidatus Cloacimonadota bacterium]
MNGKVLLLIPLLLVSTILSPEVFLPEIYLTGVKPLVNNQIDIYKFSRGSTYFMNSLDFLSAVEIKTEAEVNYEDRMVTLTLKIGRTTIHPPIYIPLDLYIEENFRSEFKQSITAIIRQLLEDKERVSDSGLIPEIVIDLPKIALPKAVRKLMGNKAGRLNLDGSQKLTFSGGSTVRKTPAKSEEDQRADFNLEMRQDLNLRLRGTIGEKIHVDVTHNSSSDDNMLTQPNDINISYQGFEDEVVHTIEGGNINLALSGSKFISYSASSEGLFGIKSEMEVGNLKLTTIIGKDEAKKSKQKYRGNTQADSVNVPSKNFIKRQIFYIDDPQLLYDLYGPEDTMKDGSPLPASWIDNAIKTDDNGAWIIPNPQFLPDPGTVQVFVDDNNASNDEGLLNGVDLQGNSYIFERLIEGSNFTVDPELGIIYFNNIINREYMIGVTYTRNGGEPIGDPNSDPVVVKMIKRSNQSSSTDTWLQSARNFYSLGIENIKNEGFKLDVFYFNSDNSKNFYTPDGWLLNDYLRLDTSNDDIINNDDETVDLRGGYVIFPFLEPFLPLGDSLMYINEDNVYNEDWKHYIAVKGSVGRDQISLGQLNVLPGSVDISLKYQDGRTVDLKENVDFVVDYDFGIISILNSDAKDNDNELDITYQFKPLFAIESKTLMGIRADMAFTDRIKMGGTFIYQSEKVSEDHPKIGSENRSIILADLDGSMEYDTPFLTRFIDWLPLIRTDEESNISIFGEVAMSLPRIYGSPEQHDKKEAYVDDMESILDSYPLGVTRPSWSAASHPLDIDYGKADIYWYQPDNIYARDVYDEETLTNKEEREEITVLACKIIPPEIGNPGTSPKSWAGIMKYVGNQIDYSKKKYIEVLVKVDSIPTIPNPDPVIMHVDLGDINEDFYTNFGGEGLLNTEDGKYGGNSDGNFQYQEDVGLDGIADGDPGDDPNDNQDDSSPIIDGEEEWPFLNGTENNGALDTEDLDGNGYLNETDIYFEYSAPLLGNESPYFISEYNGWELYRIPLHNPDPELYHIVTEDPALEPDLKKISYARVWFEVQDRTRIKIVNIDLVGNKWEEAPFRTADGINLVSDPAEDENMLVGVIDNQKNEHYESAPHTVIKKEGTTEIEQSLIIDYNNLQTGHMGFARQRFTDTRNQTKGLDLLGYDKIRFWIYTETAETTGPDSLIIRLGADSLNYYEIRYPTEPQLTLEQPVMDKDGWRELEFAFSEITWLKNLSEFGDTAYSAYKDSILVKFSKRGRPTLSNIKEISLGIVAYENFSGRLYFNDIRVADPYEDIGFGAQTNFHTKFADFSTLDIDFKWRTPNFQTSASRTQSMTYEQKTELGISSKYFLNKFFPAEWGLNIPLTLNRNYSLGIPRFKANSDILREDLSPEEKEREKSESLIYSASLNFSQNKTPRSKILEYTIKNTTINTTIQKKYLLSPTSADTTLSYSVKHTYKLNLPKDKMSLRLISNYRFYFFPNVFENTLNYKVEYPNRWRWETYSDSIPHWVPQTNVKDTKTLDTDSYIKYDILSDLYASYKLTTKRDLMLKQKLYGLPLGVEKNRTQTVTLNYNPDFIDNIFNLNNDLKITYAEDHKKVSSSGDDDDLSLYKYEGDVDRRIGVDVTLKNRDLLNSLVSKLSRSGTPPPGRDTQQPRQEVQRQEPETEKTLRTSPPDEKFENYPGEELRIPEERREESEREENILPREELPGEKVDQEPESIAPEPPPAQEKQGDNVMVKLLGYLAKLDNIDINYDNSYSTDYDQRENRPPFLYQLGLPDILTDEELNRKRFTDKISGNTSLALLSNITTDWRYSIEFEKTFGQGGTSGRLTRTTNFPDVTVTLIDFEKLIRAEEILTSSRLSSTYRLTKIYDENLVTNKPNSEKTTQNFQPLLSWTGNWVKNVTSSLAFNYRTGENLTYSSETNPIIRNEQTYSLNGNVSWSVTAARGLKIPFLKKKLALKNELTTNLGVSYEKVFNTKTTSAGKDVEKNLIKYSVSPGASYKFSQSITAGLDSNYNYSHDKQSNFEITTFSISIWIQIMF